MLDFPDIDGVKEIQYKIVKSYSKYAEQSIASKQKERYEEAIKTAKNYNKRYPESEYLTQIKVLNEKAHFNIIKSTYNFAMGTSYSKKVKLLNEMDAIYSKHFSNITDELLQEKANLFLEKSYFQKIKSAYTQAQDSNIKDKSKHYKSAIAAYNIFSTKYVKSKFLNEAKRIFLASEKNYKKHSNG